MLALLTAANAALSVQSMDVQKTALGGGEEISRDVVVVVVASF